ncbi:lipopolysaccharide biosynthesis protein [Flammeovirga kamogawensis]|uniref:Lipopolysaccharide biosynthesis protein n=1 Tax=Flammeovirga kamogawensis TaxID=373891 RepID=A0ABX8GSC7_9BACT|nr:lipopolysaccharide biosynthesis protein [Flammeovirga kamogawensis]MBB6461525.1 O-antigen/teichoic acid export membrane protein [Flammeovirga kamogawensis]QWG06416.1 lipopolysaccharide biosynthesis protein [Flammeovirga kamogawensis]
MKNIILLTGSSFLVQLIPFLISPILSRFYSPEDFGELGLFNQSVSILVIFFTLSFEQAIVIVKKNETAINLIKGIYSISLIGLLLVISSLIILKTFSISVQFDTLSNDFIIYLPFSVFLYSLILCSTNLSNRFKEYRFLSILKLVQVITTNSLYLLNFLSLITGRLFGLLAAGIFSFAYFIKKKSGFELSNKKISQSLSSNVNFAKYTSIHSLANTIVGSLPMFLLSSYYSLSIVGYYSFTFTMMFVPVQLIAASIGGVLKQDFSQKYYKGTLELTKVYKFYKKLVLLLVIPSIIFLIYSPQIFSLIFSEKWFESGEIARFLFPWVLSILFTSPISFLPQLFNRQKQALFIEIITSIIKSITLFVCCEILLEYELTILLFSIVATLSVLTNLIWYFWLIKYKKIDK